jgi:hypothetical protein
VTDRDDDGLDLVTGPSAESPSDVGHPAWGASALVAVSTAAAVVVAAWGAIDWVSLVLDRATPEISFFGAVEPPTSWRERDDAQRAAGRVLIGGAIALVGAGTAWFLRRSVAAMLLGGLVGICLISGLAMRAGVTPDDPPAEHVPGCAEHSGEPNTCPGG